MNVYKVFRLKWIKAPKNEIGQVCGLVVPGGPSLPSFVLRRLGKPDFMVEGSVGDLWVPFHSSQTTAVEIVSLLKLKTIEVFV